MSDGRWVRVLAIATATLILASCRSLTAPLATGVSAVTVLPADVAPRDAAHSVSLTAALVDVDVTPATTTTTAARPRRHEGVVHAGLEPPCSPLPRLSAAAVPASWAAPCRDGACRGDARPTTAWETAVCSTGHGAIPVVRPCLVCDGGDHAAPAKAVGEAGLANLTAGDTVARFRPADDGPEADRVEVVESNCACVYAPRFAAVREVVRPLEESAPLGLGGLVNEEPVAYEIDRQLVCDDVQSLAPIAARKALPGVAVQERLAALAVDQGALPRAHDGIEHPGERLATESLDLAGGREQPFAMVGFDVPIAWTSIAAANVLVNEQAAEVVAADRGTATLRFEEPGRAELTLCKRAGADTARVGEELDFTIYLLNSGDRPLTAITLADALPERLRFVPGSAAASLPAEFATETGDDGAVVLTWRLTAPLPAGAGGFVRFRTLVR
ncbi:MAG: DUF11 domain-containing protein [Planctomycetes bacterium]|nr:DUF11 domain-containing protein [Planctomycetota bacterium]